MVVLAPLSSHPPASSHLPAAASASSRYGPSVAEHKTASEPLLCSVAPSNHGSVSSALSSAPAPLLAMLYLPDSFAGIQSTDSGEVVVTARFLTMPSYVPFWSVALCSSPPSCSSVDDGPWVHLTDPSGRYLSTHADDSSPAPTGKRRQRVVVSCQCTDECKWRLARVKPRGSIIVTLQSSAGLSLQWRRTGGLLCREQSGSGHPLPNLLLPIRWQSRVLDLNRWEFRAFSLALDQRDEQPSCSSVRVTSLDSHKPETLLTAMPDTSLQLAAPASSSTGAEWRLVRSAYFADTVYLRSPTTGLYLTADHSLLLVAVLMAPKCEASRWRLAVSSTGNSQRGDEGTRATLQNVITGWYLQAKPRWLTGRNLWVQCVRKPKLATTFIVSPAKPATVHPLSTMD